MKSRHRAREIALQVLYRYDVAAHSGGVNHVPSSRELAAEIAEHFDHFQVNAELREFAAQLVAGTLRDLTYLDQLLERQASNWKVSRMGFVDRSLLRMALYELIHFPDTQVAVIIDEAVELGKQFGTADTPSFVNGILDAVKNSIQRDGDLDPAVGS
jgi:N utilization substance protein B